MKLWIDDVRPAPEGYVWIKSVHEAKIHCCQRISSKHILHIDEISLDHDAGVYHCFGGDYIEFLKWLEEKCVMCDWIVPTAFRLHFANPVGVTNMRRIIKRNDWKEIKDNDYK